MFHERFNIRVFIDDYLDILEKVKEYEKGIEGMRPRHHETIETIEIKEEEIFTRAQMTKFLRKKYSAQDEITLRARTFILACLHATDQGEKELG